jgi:hypothetical protein
VQFAPFEETAYDRMVNITHLSSAFTPHLFLSTTNSKYAQRVGRLRRLAGSCRPVASSLTSRSRADRRR